MNNDIQDLHSRRTFLHRMGQLSLAGVSTPMALNLAAMGEAAASTVRASTGP